MTTRPQNPLLSIVSPVYGAPKLLAELVRRIATAAEIVTPSFEIVLVNDSCPNDS